MTVEKNLRLTGISDVSWKDAINKTIMEASKSIDYISSVTVVEQKAKVDGNKIVQYYSTIDLSFTIDETRENRKED